LQSSGKKTLTQNNKFASVKKEEKKKTRQERGATREKKDNKEM